MKRNIYYIIITILVLFILGACSLPSGSSGGGKNHPEEETYIICPLPLSGSLNLDVNTELGWYYKNLEVTENVAFDLYFGTSPEPGLYAENLDSSAVDLTGLAYDTRYFWRIEIKDTDKIITSPVFDFTTRANDPAYEENILLVIEGSIYPEIEESLLQYMEDLINENLCPIVVTWESGTVEDLKKQITHLYYSNDSIFRGTFIIGNLPCAWFERINEGGNYEQFPCELYLMDMNATWADNDNDGMFDYHSDLVIETYASRIMGTTAEINHYFDKVHDYKTNGSLVSKWVFIYKDDDWSGGNVENKYYLDYIYSQFYFITNSNVTTRSAYISALTTNSFMSGAEYVYQWIHSSPSTLFIEGVGEGTVTVDDIANYNFKGSFYNLFNCSAARFTENNLAMAYLVKTDYGLAVTGSTKPGGNYNAYYFNMALASAWTWGDAFRHSYNVFMNDDDNWFLGMTILGDPTLTISKETGLSLMQDSAETQSTIDKKLLDEIMRKQQKYDNSQSFEQYKKENLQFYE
ncbi:MAG: hypothetical protein JW822_04945 [Spirochaetales bacterium]|nr:hypothetical protein [Spirochaetales bacterium]